MYYLAQVAYYELNIDYIIQTYCVNTDKPQLQCNGKCHLAKQLQLDDNSNSEDDAPNGTAVILECFYPIFHSVQDYTLTTHCQWGTDTNISNHYTNAYAYLRDMSLLKPPKSKF